MLLGSVNVYAQSGFGSIKRHELYEEMQSLGIERILSSQYTTNEEIDYMNNNMTHVLPSRYDIYQDTSNPEYETNGWLSWHPQWIKEAYPDELIVNADDLRRLQKHINYPLVVQAINESRGRVVQHSSGIYRIPDTPQPTRPTPVNGPEANGLLERLASAIEMLENNGISASVSLSEFEKKQRLRDRSRKIGSK